MKISSMDVLSVPVNQRGNWLFVRVHTSDGFMGVGEASHSQDDGRVVSLIATRVAPVLIERSPDDVLVLRTRVQEAIGLCAGDLPAQTAASGVEQALWDLAGRIIGRPVHELVGGSLRNRIPLYANINRATVDRTPEEMAAIAKSAVAAGFRAVKCAPFDELSPVELDGNLTRYAIGAGIERLVAIRRAIGKDVELMVDCQARCGPAVALEVAQRLWEIGVHWCEEPVTAHQVNSLRSIVEATDLVVATGEHLFGYPAFVEYLNWERPVVIMPDVKHAGGIAECLAIAQAANAVGRDISLHNPSSPISTAASLHVAACVPRCLPLEFAWGEVSWRSSLVHPPERVIDGSLEIPTGPGLGVELRNPSRGPTLRLIWSS